MTKGQRPDYNLSLKNMDTGHHASVGKAYVGENGHVAVYINPGVTLTYEHSSKPWVLRMFQVTDYHKGTPHDDADYPPEGYEVNS